MLLDILDPALEYTTRPTKGSDPAATMVKTMRRMTKRSDPGHAGTLEPTATCRSSVTPRSEGGTTLEPTMASSEDGQREAPIRPQGSDGCEGRRVEGQVRGWRRVLMGEGRRAADGDRGGRTARGEQGHNTKERRNPRRASAWERGRGKRAVGADVYLQPNGWWWAAERLG